MIAYEISILVIFTIVFNLIISINGGPSYRYKRDFMFVTDENVTDASCFQGCQDEYRKKFEYTFNQSLADFYDFPIHPILLELSSFQLYCALSDMKTKCFSKNCNDFTSDTSFSPSNFVCTFKRVEFEKSLKCMSKAEPITFLKCDHECREDMSHQEIQTKPHQFVPTDMNSYESQLDELCRFQSCYATCMQPIIKDMCTAEETENVTKLFDEYIKWHADDIYDWHAITGNEDSLPKSCQDLKSENRNFKDPILQIIESA